MINCNNYRGSWSYRKVICQGILLGCVLNYSSIFSDTFYTDFNFKLHYFLADCFFYDGFMQGGAAEYVANIDNKTTCMRRVKQDHPNAYGATWYLNGTCWAEFGEHFVHSSFHNTCRFRGH